MSGSIQSLTGQPVRRDRISRAGAGRLRGQVLTMPWALGLTRSLVREGTPIGQPSASAEPQGQGPPGPASGRIGPVPRQQMTKNSILPPPPPR